MWHEYDYSGYIKDAICSTSFWNAQTPAFRAAHRTYYVDLSALGASGNWAGTFAANQVALGYEDITQNSVATITADLDGNEAAIDMQGNKIYDNFADGTITLDSSGIKILNVHSVSTQAKSVAYRHFIINQEHAILNNLIMDGGSHTGSGLLANNDIDVSNVIFKNYTNSATYGAYFKGGSFGGTYALLENLTFYNNSLDFRSNISSEHTLRNIYAKFNGTPTDGGGLVSPDTSAPEVANQNKAAVDMFEDLVDFIPKSEDMNVGVIPTLSLNDVSLNGYSRVSPYWVGANRAIPAIPTEGGFFKNKYNYSYSLTV